MDNKMNEPTLLDRGVLKQVVDEVMQESSKIDIELNNFAINAEDFKDGEEIDEDQKIVLSDAVSSNEMFTDMWGRSLCAALTDITYTTIPHFSVIEKCLVYILNSETLNFGIVKTLLTKLLFFHPPHTPAMETYYWHILTDLYVVLDYGCMESENIFFTVVRCLSANLENPVLIKDKENQILGMRDYWSTERDSMTILNYTMRIYFNHLPVSKQFDRMLIIFEFLYEILQKNFVHRMKKNTVHTQTDRCLLSRLLWSQVVDVGTVSQSLKRLHRLIVLMGIPSENHVGQTHKKVMVLLSEFFRYIDSDKNFNPFHKNKKSCLVAELSLKLYKSFRNQFTPQGVKYLSMVRPHSLRFAISCKWLSYITSTFCPAELNSVCEVVKLLCNYISKKRLYRGIYDVRNRNRGRNAGNDEDGRGSGPVLRYCSADCVLKKSKKSKKIKITAEEIEDSYGWAPLQKAIKLGHNICVENMINFAGEPEPDEAFETRIPGYKWFAPLLCDLVQEQGKVCSLLMNHSGYSLFEAINMMSDPPIDILGGYNTWQTEIWSKFHFAKTDTPHIVDICTVLVESYFVTYRIPDVISRLKAYKSGSSDAVKKKDEKTKECNYDPEQPTTSTGTEYREEPKEWEYDRYEKDVTENLEKLCKLMTLFADRREIKKSLEPLNKFLHNVTED